MGYCKLTISGLQKLEERLNELRTGEVVRTSEVARQGGIAEETVIRIRQRRQRVMLRLVERFFDSLGLDLLSPEDSENSDYEICNQILPNQEPQSSILLGIDHQHFSFARQISEVLEDSGKLVSIVENWLQQSDEQIERYDCFLLLESSNSTSEAISAKVERIKQLQSRRTDNKPVIALIHVGTALSLAIDDPLHRDLLNIPQQRWLPNDENSTQILVQFVQELFQSESLVASDKLQSLVGWNELLRSSGTINNLENWLLTYVGEHPLRKLGGLVDNFVDSANLRIPSGYAYWGLGPAHMWSQACNDPRAHMNDGISKFTEYTKPLFKHINREKFNFVSLGVGEGSKDSNIISNFFLSGNNQSREDFLYIAVLNDL